MSASRDLVNHLLDEITRAAAATKQAVDTDPAIVPVSRQEMAVKDIASSVDFDGSYTLHHLVYGVSVTVHNDAAAPNIAPHAHRARAIAVRALRAMVEITRQEQER